MAKLQRYTQISHDSGENGHEYSFVNLAYNEDNGNAEDIERRWKFDEDEPKFKPRKKRCTKVNVAVALVILAAGGLGIFLIVKLSQDHQKVYTTPQPGPLESTQIPSSTSIPSLTPSTTMTSSTPTATPASTSGPPITSPSTSTLSTPSTTQTPMTTPSTTSQPMTSPSPTLTTSSTTTSISHPPTTISTATTPQPISTTKLMTTTTLSPVTTSNSSIGTTTTIPTTISGTNTTSQSLMTTTSLSEKSTASTTTIISSSTNASTTTTTTTAPTPKSTSAVTTTLPPTTTATSNVVSTTQEVTTHTTTNGTNITESAGMMFDASMTVTSVTWEENYRNSTSDAYLDLVSDFTSQVEEGIKNSEVGSSFSHVTVTSVSPGSVVFDFRIHMTSSSYSSGGSQAPITISVVRGVLVQVVQNAKANGTQTLLLGTDETKIVVNTVIETTGMPPTTKMTTSLPTATTFNASKSTLPHTTETTTTPRVTTTTVSTTLSPCSNSTYLSTTLLSYCIELSRLNEMVNASEDVKCKYILTAVDCVLEKIRVDFGVNCTDEHKIAALQEFSGTVQTYLGIDPKICDLPITMTTTKPTMTTAVSTTSSPCTNSSYLTSTLLSVCINSSRLNEVTNSSDDVKCNFILSAVDCVLEKIRLDFGVNCTDEHKIAALQEFSGTVQIYLGIDPKICDLPITMTTTKPTMTTAVSTTTSPCTNSSYLTSTLLSVCINSSRLNEVTNSSNDVKCNFILSAVDCVLEKIRLDFGVNCTDEHKIAALQEFSGTVQIYLGIDPKICDLPITMTTTKPTMTTAVSTTTSPCTNSSYLTSTLLSVCINTSRLNEVTNSSNDVKCNFILSAVDCVLEKIRVDFGVNCTYEHKIAALEEFSGTVQIYLGIDPKICDLPITMTTTKPTMTTAVSTTASPCKNSTYLTSTLLSNCINSSQLIELANASDDVKCKYILSAVDCVLEKILVDFGVNCTDEHKIAALEEFSGTVQIYLGIDPKICDLPITMTTTKPTMTTAVSTTTSPCTNSSYLTSTLLSVCINISRLNEVTNSSNDVKCNFILSAVDCVLENIRLDFGVNCTDEHKIAALQEFSGTVQIYLGIDPKICDLPITMTTTKPTMTTAVSTTTSPCTNSTYLISTLLSNCINSSQLSEVANASDDVKCKYILSAVDCVLEKILVDFGVNCTDEHKIAALEEFSVTVQLYLHIDPKICYLPITMSTTKSTSSGEISSSPHTSTTPLTTTMSSTTTPTTARSTTRTETTAINPCMNSTYLSSILSQSSCIADSNKLEEVKNASDEVKCNYISSIVACVLEGVRSDIGITCTDKQKIVALYEIEELGLSYLSIDPRTCDLSANISTTQTTSATTTLSGATTSTTKTTTMTTVTNNIKTTTTPITTTMTTTTPMTTSTPMTTTMKTTTPMKTTTTTPLTTTMTTTMIKSTTPVTTTINPCTNSTYLSSTLLSHCLDYNQLAAVISASEEVKCNFILSAVDCVLEKIRLDFGITCTVEHRVAALDEFSGIVQTYLGVDPKTC